MLSFYALKPQGGGAPKYYVVTPQVFVRPPPFGVQALAEGVVHALEVVFSP